MVSVSHIVRKLISEKPMVYECLIEGVISFAALAEYMQEDIEKELGKKVQLPAIVMAVRRYAETIQKKEDIKKEFRFRSEIIMKTGLADITLIKSPTAIMSLKRLYSTVQLDKGDTLNVIHGNYEITIVISEKYIGDVKNIFADEKVLNIETDLVSMSISFSDDFLYTPGVLAKVTRKLAWENINIFENISTLTELIFIITKKDSVRAYKALESLISQ